MQSAVGDGGSGERGEMHQHLLLWWGCSFCSVPHASVGWSVGGIPKYHHPQTTFKSSLRRSVRLLNISNLPPDLKMLPVTSSPSCPQARYHELDYVTLGGLGLIFLHLVGHPGAQLRSPDPVFRVGTMKCEKRPVQTRHTGRVSCLSAGGEWLKMTRFGWGRFLEKTVWFFPTLKPVSERENLHGGAEAANRSAWRTFLGIKREL